MRLLMLKEIPEGEALAAVQRVEPSLDAGKMEAYLHTLRVGDEMHRVVSGQLSAHGISKGGFVLLMHLYEPLGGDVDWTPGALAESVGVRRATITGLLDTLEREGLLERERDMVNRRQVHVRLTERGRAVMKAALPEHFRLVNKMIEGLSEEELAVMVKIHRKLLAHLAGMGREAAEGKN